MACAGAAVLLGGCVSARQMFSDATVDPTSPVAGEVARLSKTGDDWPSFHEIPETPKDLRPRRLYGQAARDVAQASAEIERQTAPSAWTLQGTDTFAAGARSAAGSEPAPSDAGGTEAFAEDLRKRATPPPPPRN
ncbi:hypothetical protein [Phenylobacterium sp. J367]|uniref:hypothetical protein n=1 Tax=Phenylobacterium sp. J367 TaxID=2898435 RepID=UPI002151B5D2|nr:hypothetical protein [Phenylobacterium sp. J367]MCR5880360.1 hypothetical protein [Phenylobacterium sp. J367]